MKIFYIKNKKISYFLYKKKIFKYYNFIQKIYNIFNNTYLNKNSINKFLYYTPKWNKFLRRKKFQNNIISTNYLPKRWKINLKKIFKSFLKIGDENERKKYIEKVIDLRIWRQNIWYHKKKNWFKKREYKNILKILINYKKTNIFLTCFEKKKIIWTLSLGKLKIFDRKEKKTIYPIHKIIKYILLWFSQLKKKKDLIILIKFSLIKPKIFLVYYFLKLLKLSKLPVLEIKNLTTIAHNSGIRLAKRRRI
jgi:hypothetical protein